MKTTIIILFFLAGCIYGQTASINFGYTDYDLPEQHRLFSTSIKNFNINYPDFGIPIQKEFPANTIFGGTISFAPFYWGRVGIVLFKGSTAAYALYGDQLGEIDIRAKYEGWLVGGFAEGYMVHSTVLNLYLGGNLSIGSADYSMSTQVRFLHYPEDNSYDTKSYSKTILAFEPYLLFSIPCAESFSLNLHIGYRLGGSLEPTSDQNDFNPYMTKESYNDEDPAIGIFGPVLMLGLEMNLKVLSGSGSSDK